jgi:hypothetical protein
MTMKAAKRRGRPPGSKNKPAAKKSADNLSPWLNEVSDLNQEVNALRRQLSDAKAVIRYLEFQLNFRPYEDLAI